VLVALDERRVDVETLLDTIRSVETRRDAQGDLWLIPAASGDPVGKRVMCPPRHSVGHDWPADR
jgi:hypothetical protein